MGQLRNEPRRHLPGHEIGDDLQVGRYRQAGLWLTDEEFLELLSDLRAVLQARTANRADGTRRRRLISTVTMPGE